MEKEGIEILQVLYKDFSLKEIIDPKFLGNLQKEFENVQIVNIVIATGNDEKSQDAITLMHLTPEYEKERKIIVDTKNENELNKIISVIEKQKNGD